MSFDLAAISDSIKDAWMQIDGLQDISYYTRIGPAVNDFLPSKSCQGLKRMNTKKGEPTDGVEVAENRADWSIWVGTMPIEFVPAKGDRFTASGISGLKSWDVLSVDYCDFTTRYRLHCKQAGASG